MVSVFLCDNNRENIEKYSKMITETAARHQIKIKISTFANTEELYFCLSGSPGLAEIIYLDVLTGPASGMATAKKLRASGCDAEIIFLAANADFVFEAFDVSPVQYLIKDQTTPKKFEQVFLRAVSLATGEKAEMFLCQKGSVYKTFPLEEISFFEIWKRLVRVHCQDGQTFDFYTTMDKLENSLEGKNFLRVHRSFLINLRHIKQVQSKHLTLTTKNVIPIGVTYASKVKEIFLKQVKLLDT